VTAPTGLDAESTLSIPKPSDIAGVTAPFAPSQALDAAPSATPDDDDNEDLSGYVSYDEVMARKEHDPPPCPARPPAPTPCSAALTHQYLNDAWHTLARALQPHVRDSVTFNAQLLRIPEWQLICGLIVHLWQSASLTMPVLDPAWQSQTPILETVSKCPECGKEYQPVWRNQAYCSNACGMAAEKRRVSGMRKVA